MMHIIDKATFEKEVLNETKKSVLVDFYADWCGPCRALAPLIEEIANENPQHKVVKINVDQASELAQAYNIMSIPTVFVFKQGKVTMQFLEPQDKAHYLEALE